MAALAQRVERLAPWAAGLLLAAPVLVAYYPPMTDLPFHEAAVAILAGFDDAARYPPGLYERNLGEPNQLFHLLAWALAHVASTRWAVKLVVAGGVMAIPVGAARLARHAGSSPIAALVVAPMALGWLFSWGLVANLLGLGALLAALPTLDRASAEPSPPGTARVLAWTALLYMAHLAMMLVYAGAALALALLRPGSWRVAAHRMAAVLGAAALVAFQALLEVPYVTSTQAAVARTWEPVATKLERIPAIVCPAPDRVVNLATFALCAGAIAALVWLRERERGARREPADASRLARVRAWGLVHRWELVAAACLAAYLVFPASMRGATLVYQRWFPPAFAVLAATSAPRDVWTRVARVPRLVALLLPAATLLVSWPSFADADRQYRAFEDLLPRIATGSAVAFLELGPGDPTRTFSMGTSGGRVLAMRGGRLDYAFTDTSISPVVVAPAHRWEESLGRIGYDSWAFRPDHDLGMFRYVVARTSSAEIGQAVTLALAGKARLVATSSEWLLFESRRPTVPVLAPEPPMELPPPPQLREIVARMLARP